MIKHIWLRAETKPFEKRAPILPEHAGVLIENGYKVSVEKSDTRVFHDYEYEEAGCRMVESGSWPDAPLDAYILGIKELPEDNFPIRHKHIYFPYAYEDYEKSKQVLNRFCAGGGIPLDLEQLTGFRNAQLVTTSAGFWAGICGTAISIFIWQQKHLGQKPPFTIPTYYPDYQSLIHDMVQKIEPLNKPNILIIGPNGMLGSGARFFLEEIGVGYVGWTRATTMHGVPSDILNYDIMLNCIRIDEKTPILLTHQSLKENKKLSVIGDLTCHPERQYTPLPLYEYPTSFSSPTVRVNPEGTPVDIMAIDHVTTLLPRESSYGLAEQLFPYLCQLLVIQDSYQYTPWEKVITKFQEHNS
ncbi:MAG: alanine dehydrogenase/PNT domain protein [Gammaproteobacteria bacterium]|jgi:saccharopine dehydrogenase (NAD+, L-lysine-forming)|nr:alanine dehydrogenase/PNT domain protein [Gammaproteobacteria bacterium]